MPRPQLKIGCPRLQVLSFDILAKHMKRITGIEEFVMIDIIQERGYNVLKRGVTGSLGFIWL